jgi:outer membrane murein-binding lipoprotein Lpp
MAGLGKLSAVASTIVDEKGKTYLFYQPQPNVIAQYGVNEGARIPLGIPTSLGKALLEKKEECDSSGSPGSTKAPSGSFDKQQQEDLNKDKDGECTTSIRELHSQIKDLLAQIATTKAEAQTAKNELNQVNKSAQLLKQERDSARSARDVAVAKIAEISSVSSE